jgi:sensor c-di-GMP phosphodiesterase-like protein
MVQSAMRTLAQRTVFTSLSILFLSAAGTLGGYVIGRVVSLQQAQSRLDQYAIRILKEARSSTAESRAVLATMNSSPYPLCSDAEIDYFLKLIYQSEYLKAGGRMQNGNILCSTAFGRTSAAGAHYEPEISRQDGTRLYRNIPPFRVDDQTVISVQLGDSFVVYNPYNLQNLAAPPMRYTATAIDEPGRQTAQILGVLPTTAGPILTTEGATRFGNTLFVTRCSREYASCITTYVSVPEALQMNRGLFNASLVMGGFSGMLLGLMCPILYSRNKSLEHQLLRAIRNDSLNVVYQPIVDLATGRIVEAEALVRFTDEYKNAVSPDVFVKIAEARGFVGQITKLVVRHALHDFANTMRARPGFRVNVNIAAPDLADPSFLSMLDGILAEAEISPRSLGIEITETYTARQQVAKDTIHRLRQKGHFVHIDDFGTGYSSLAYLHDLSVDAIKIDKVFTKAIGTDAVTGSILPQILTMAETLKLHVVVEGIETQAQAEYFATRNGTIYAQGWLFGHPVPARVFLQMLDEEESRRDAQNLSDGLNEATAAVPAF